MVGGLRGKEKWGSWGRTVIRQIVSSTSGVVRRAPAASLESLPESHHEAKILFSTYTKPKEYKGYFITIPMNAHFMYFIRFPPNPIKKGQMLEVGLSSRIKGTNQSCSFTKEETPYLLPSNPDGEGWGS